MLPWRFTFVYGPPEDLTTWRTSLPVRPWDREVGGEGGALRSATGVFASYTVREDNVLLVTVHFLEHEWVDFQSVVRWGQGGWPFDVYPDVSADLTEVYTVDLESPRAGEKYRPTRSTQYPRAHELTIALRRVDGEAWDLNYVPLPTGGLAWVPE
jgi:hypothetical protein